MKVRIAHIFIGRMKGFTVRRGRLRGFVQETVQPNRWTWRVVNVYLQHRVIAEGFEDNEVDAINRVVKVLHYYRDHPKELEQ